VGHFCPPGSGSTGPIEYGSNPDPDPKPWYKVALSHNVRNMRAILLMPPFRGVEDLGFDLDQQNHEPDPKSYTKLKFDFHLEIVLIFSFIKSVSGTEQKAMIRINISRIQAAAIIIYTQIRVIRQCCGSRKFIPDPGTQFFPPESRV